jgi:hypothetical protein
MNRCAVVALLLSGCDGAFDLVHVTSRGVDAASDDGDVDAATAICLEDHFEAAIDPAIWAAYGAGSGVLVRTSNGVAEILVPAATTAAQQPYGGFTTAPRTYIGTAAQFELVQVPAGSAPSEVTVQFTIDPMNYYRISVQSSMLTFGKNVNGVPFAKSMTYSSAAHRFVRMRHDVPAGEIVFEVRGATGDFSEVGRTPATLSLGAAYFEVYAGSYNIAPAFIVRVDNALVLGDCPL